MSDSENHTVDRRLSELEARLLALEESVLELGGDEDGAAPVDPPELVGAGGIQCRAQGRAIVIDGSSVAGRAAVDKAQTWRIVPARGGVRVVNCIVSTGGMLHVFSSEAMAAPGDGTLVCRLVFDERSVAATFRVDEEGVGTPGDGGLVSYDMESEPDILDIPLYEFAGGRVVRDFIHGVFCPFVYDRAFGRDLEISGSVP